MGSTREESHCILLKAHEKEYFLNTGFPCVHGLPVATRKRHSDRNNNLLTKRSVYGGSCSSLALKPNLVSGACYKIIIGCRNLYANNNKVFCLFVLEPLLSAWHCIMKSVLYR